MKIDIQYIKRAERFPIRFIDLLNGLFLLFPTMLILLGSVMIKSYKMNNMTGLNGLLIAALTGGLIGIILFIFITRRLIQNLKFTKVVTGQDFKTNIEIINSAFAKLYDKQSIDKAQIDKGILTANSGISMFSWGEINTAICFDKVILINSRPTEQPVTIFENRLNVKRIIKNIETQIKP